MPTAVRDDAPQRDRHYLGTVTFTAAGELSGPITVTLRDEPYTRLLDEDRQPVRVDEQRPIRIDRIGE